MSDEHPDESCDQCMWCPACAEMDDATGDLYADRVHVWAKPGVRLAHCNACHGLGMICLRYDFAAECGALVKAVA